MAFITGLKSTAGEGRYFANKLYPVTSCVNNNQGRVTSVTPNIDASNAWYSMADPIGLNYINGAFTISKICVGNIPSTLIAELPFYDAELENIKIYFQCWFSCEVTSSSWTKAHVSFRWSKESGTYVQPTIAHPNDLNDWTQQNNLGTSPTASLYFSLVYDETLGTNGYCGFVFGRSRITVDNVSKWAVTSFTNYQQLYNITTLANTYGLYAKKVTESEEFGEPSTEGGYTGGTFDDSSDTISIPTAPTMGVTSAGFINVYSPTAGELQMFGAELFPNLSFTPVSQSGTPASVTDAVVAMAQVLVDFGNQIPALIDMYINANLIQYVIDCHIIPVAPTTSGTSALKVGFKTFSQTPAKVTSDYVDFDCGTLNVGEYYANFIDYSPYTSAKLYLPFVGFMDIAPEYWQNGSLQVVYRFNVIDGSFVAYVKSTSSKSKLSDTVIAQFGGNACVHIPITGLNYANMVSGIVSAVSPLLPSSKANVGTVDKLVNSANTIASAKPTMQQSNGYNATTSFLTVRTPYLLIERSVSNFSMKYDEENGIPSNITLDFSTLSGFTKATMLHLDGIAGATEDDLDEIAQLLSEGVIL